MVNGTNAPADVKLRAATPEDLPAILRIDGQSFKHPWQPRSFETSLADEKTLFVVAQLEGRVVGYGVVYTVRDESEIATLGVAAELRGRGIGTLILHSLIEDCHARGAHTVFLEVRVSNVAARRMYERYAFVEVGRRRGYYQDGEDAIIMKHRKAGT